MANWVNACAIDEIEDEDVMPFESEGKAYAIFRTADGEISAGDGYCTHERQMLCQGLVMGSVIECPKHNGRFDVRSGQALGAPVIVNLKMYPVKIENEHVYVDVEG